MSYECCALRLATVVERPFFVYLFKNAKRHQIKLITHHL